MRKIPLLLALSGVLSLGILSGFSSHNVVKVFDAQSAPEDPDEYDHWLNSWSKPGHVYVHYNRGDKKDYDDFCIWVWNQTKDLEGTLWANGSNPKIAGESDHFMSELETGVSSANTTYIDKYGVICDIDLTRSSYVDGKYKKETDYKNVAGDGFCEELGFLFPRKDSMDGTSHWTSDGGRNIYVDDWTVAENQRQVSGGTTTHIFFSSGQLYNYSFFAGSGTPEVLVNPIDSDTTGAYSSKAQTIPDTYGVSTTSEAFKELGVGYQVFVASFRDSNGDGYGDIRGIIDSLDYFKDLGIECLWLTPIQQSDSYHGYDISDYYAVDKRFGTIEDYRELIYKAHKAGIKVIMDLVLNHTSKSNIWYTNSQWGVNSGIPGTKTDKTGINWRNVYNWKHANDKIWRIERTLVGNEYQFGDYVQKTVAEDASQDGASWFRDGESNYYYYGKFGSGMPELNYSCTDTRKLVEDMAKYWLSFGLDGFRLDAVKHIFMKDEVADSTGDVIITDVGTKHVYDEELFKNIDQPYDYSTDLTKNVAFWKEFANELKSVYPNCFLVGENFDGWGTRTAPYYQALDSQFDFSNYYHIPAWIWNGGGAGSAFSQKQAAETYDTFAGNGPFDLSGKGKVPGGRRPDFINGAYTSNHDVARAINQANGVGNAESTTPKDKVLGTAEEIGRAKVQAAITLLNPGLSWVYYGDELGMSSNTDTHISTYGNENSMDIWYRQPFMWKDTNVTPGYKTGKFHLDTDHYDSYNKQLSQVEGNRIDLNNGFVSTTNEMYKFYKEVIALKHLYGKNAQINYHHFSSDNVLVIYVVSENAKDLVIFINLGLNNNPYNIDVTGSFSADFKTTPVAQIGTTKGNGDNFSDWYSVVAFQKK